MSLPAQGKKLAAISAVFPAYNDAGTIPSMVLTAIMALRQVTDDYEVIVTDDGSRDHTALVLEEMAGRYPELRVIHHAVNRGYGASIRSGFEAAVKEWIFYTDGDAQYNPLELVELVNAVEDGVDIVNGYKIARHDPLIRKIIGRLYHYFVSLTFGIRLRDVDCDFRLFKRGIFNKVHLESETGVVCVEMVKKMQDAGFVFREVPVHHYFRQYGKSQFFNFRRLLRVARHLALLYWKLVLRREHLRAGS